MESEKILSQRKIERRKKMRYRGKVARALQVAPHEGGLLLTTRSWIHHALSATEKLGLTPLEFRRLGRAFRAVVTTARQRVTLDGTGRTRRLQTNAARQPRLPRDSSFKEPNKLLLFCLRYWGGKWTQTALAKQYSMSQPQVNRWLKRALPWLGQALVNLLGSIEKAPVPSEDGNKTQAGNLVDQDLVVRLVNKVLAFDPRIVTIVHELTPKAAGGSGPVQPPG
ncbi:hypothetical protein LJY25_03440 [Hymenobacter sp. BT175]|uniref:hypothetical protein n=1 Tax=Hymenobacter translucens TaxID=2886507 RepID=UPI001D0E765C|nr:hypothetical protein [Hymenobacter translucens]MCC2545484.1 hypothetical protein [Hymenobacter translucens]